MTGHDAFGGDVAGHYDDEPRGDEHETVRFLHRLARGGAGLGF